jgi:hypothetical protein
MLTQTTSFSETDIRNLEPAMKIGILGTVNPEGLPHLTMISSLKACSPTQLCFGQFTEGVSKAHIRQNPKAGWLIMTLEKNVWRGTANFSHTTRSGAEFDAYNNTPLFRYNAYFGIHTVYYLNLVAHSGKIPLPMNQVVFASIQTMLARSLPGKRSKESVLNPWTRTFLNGLNTLKFLSYISEDGYPVIIPAIQAQSYDSQSVLFAASVYHDDLECIPAGIPLAVFGLSLSMEDVLMRGKFAGFQRVWGVRCGSVKIDWVYNSMPPVPGQIYPEMPLQAVDQFE